jgi:hypothetical protein
VSQNTKYKIQNTKYKIQNTKYKLQNYKKNRYFIFHFYELIDNKLNKFYYANSARIFDEKTEIFCRSNISPSICPKKNKNRWVLSFGRMEGGYYFIDKPKTK